MGPMTIQQEMDLALEHYGSGRLLDTEGMCREILGVQPQNAESLHLPGVLAHRARQVYGWPSRTVRRRQSSPVMTDAGIQSSCWRW
jgi:hypothetical protein